MPNMLRAQFLKLAFTNLPNADLLTFWFPCVGPYVVKIPKRDHLLFLGPLGR